MAKLFALENDGDRDDPLEKRNELLIDKVLQYDKVSKSDVSVTADLIKQRHDLRAKITDELKKQEEEEEENSGNDDSSGGSEDNNEGDSNDNGEDSGNGEGSTEESSDNGNSGGGENPDDSETKNEKSDADDEDPGSAADDLDSLRNMSGGKSKDATESFKPVSVKKTPRVFDPLSVVNIQTQLRLLFDPLKQSHKKRMTAIESFGIVHRPKPTDQPLAYVKDEVVESLSRLIKLANLYIQKNDSTIAGTSEGLRATGEKLTVYNQFVSNKKFHFSQKLIQDEGLMKALSVNGKNDLHHTASIVSRYLEDQSSLVVKILENKFELLADAFNSAGYTGESEGAMANKTMLPGFVTMCASLVPFSNYIETKYEEYQVYKLQEFKPQELYNLPAISLEDDSELNKLLKDLDKIIMSAGLIVDNLKVVNTNYQKFIEETKTIAYDVEKDDVKDLAGLGLDDKLKDFVKFKLVSELYINDLDVAVSYLTAALSALAQLIELSDK